MGRDAVQGLRASTLERNDLALAISTLGREFMTDLPAKPADFRVAVEGESRELHPIVRDEIYKVAAEALRNAFRHAQAGKLEVDIRYGNDEFRLRGVTMARASIRRSSPAAALRDTTDCVA